MTHWIVFRFKHEWAGLTAGLFLNLLRRYFMILTLQEFEEALKKAQTPADYNKLAMEIPPSKDGAEDSEDGK